LLAPFPVASASQRFRAHPQLRFSRQPQACHHFAALLPITADSPRTTTRARYFLRPAQQHLALSSMWCPDGHRRKPLGLCNSTSFSTAGRMKRLFELEFFACLGLLHISLSCSQQIPSFTFFLCAPDNIIFPPKQLFPHRVPCVLHYRTV